MWAAPLTGAGSPYSASCNAAFSTIGARSLQASYNGSIGCSLSVSAAVTQNLTAVAVPTLSEWMLWGFAGVLLTGATGVLARRARRLA